MLLDEAQVLRRVLEHARAKSTDLADEEFRSPVEGYTSPQRFAQEQALVRRLPTVLCPAAMLAEPGSYACAEVGGRRVVVARDRDGEVRAFLNACRHRGAAVAEGAGPAKAFVCPYHGWTYDLAGTLLRIPGGDRGFPTTPPEQSGLVRVRAQQRAGLVFASLAESPPWGGIDPVEAPLEAFGLGDRQVSLRWSKTLDVSWKLLMETFLEGYHIRTLHRDSFYPMGYDNLILTDLYGAHARVIFPFKRIESLADKPFEAGSLRRHVTAVYQVFPTTIVAMATYHVHVVCFEPLAPGRTRLVGYALPDARVDPAKVEDDVKFLLAGLEEDFAAAASVQGGLATQANAAFTFGRFEGVLTHFHRGLQEAVTG